MNYSRLVRLNKRQFDRQCGIEGQTIYNHSKNTSEKVIFHKISNSKSIEEKLVIYFSADSNIEKGDILLYKNNYYIVQNVNCPENDAWHASSLIKCNTVWNLFGEVIPLVSGEMGSSNPKNGSIPTVNGTIGLYTKDIDVLHTKIGIDDVFYDFGGCYKLVNKFFIDGIAFLYFQRQVFVDLDFNIKCANKKLNISEPTRAKFYLMATNESDNNNYYLPTAKFTYSSSNENVAKVNEDGMILPLKEGTFNVIAKCVYTFDYGDIITNKNTLVYTYYMPFGINTNPDYSGGTGDTETPEEPDDNTGNNPGGSGTTLPAGNLSLQLVPSVKAVINLGYNRSVNCELYVNGEKYSSVPEMPTLDFIVIYPDGKYVDDASRFITLGSKTTNNKFYITLDNNETTGLWLHYGYMLRVIATLSDGTAGYCDLIIQW